MRASKTANVTTEFLLELKENFNKHLFTIRNSKPLFVIDTKGGPELHIMYEERGMTTRHWTELLADNMSLNYNAIILMEYLKLRKIKPIPWEDMLIYTKHGIVDAVGWLP